MQIVFKGAIPPDIRPSAGVQALFQKNMLDALLPVVDAELSDIKGQTPYDSIRGGYGSSTQITGSGVTVNMFNSSPIQKYREFDTRPHWPPWSPGSSLDVWSKAKGIPTFLVARKISRVGTKGNYIVTNTAKQYQPRIEAAIREGLTNWLREALTMAGNG